MSPESLKRESQSYHTDIWSLGVLLYEMIEAKEPFKEKNVNLRLEEIQKCDIVFDKTPLKLRKMILKMVNVNHDKRLTLIEIEEFLDNI